MDIGVVKEINQNEHRVALTPREVNALVEEGHRVFVEQGAGDDCLYVDADYRQAGAEIVFRRDEAFRRSKLILGVRAPSPEDVALLDEGQTIFGFLHLVMAPRELVTELLKRKVTAIGGEMIEEKDGKVPILSAIGVLAGKMVVFIGANLLLKQGGGRGILLGAVPGVGTAKALVIGAGTVGLTAARLLAAGGVHVTILDRDPEKLRAAKNELGGSVVTQLADAQTVARLTAESVLVIGAVRIPGERAPYIVTREMVSKMKAGSVIIDVAIDQGGCVETSRPTTLSQPTFVVHNVVHYCVPNLTGNIPRTASKVLSFAQMPYVSQIAALGADEARRRNDAIRKGTYLHRGAIEAPGLKAQLGL